MNFRTISEDYNPGNHVHTYVAVRTEREGHTVTRTRSEIRMAAGRKGRAASVQTTDQYTCTCGATTIADTVREYEQLMVHFENAAEREAQEQRDAELKAIILRKLGMS